AGHADLASNDGGGHCVPAPVEISGWPRCVADAGLLWGANVIEKTEKTCLFLTMQAALWTACEQLSMAYALILTNTPAGTTSLLRASTVRALGSVMSMMRLCVRISNCSRDFLSMNGERLTVYRSIRVGSGIGPATRAPVLFAVSTISTADWSRASWS